MSKLKVVLLAGVFVIVVVIGGASFVVLHPRSVLSKDSADSFESAEIAGYKKTFPDGFENSCAKSAKTSIENNGHTIDDAIQGKITSTCKCMAAYIVQNLNDADIKTQIASMGQDMSPHMTELQSKSQEACAPK